MDNLKLPAFPTLFYNESTGQANGHSAGFTKLELASLMIAQGRLASSYVNGRPVDEGRFGEICVSIAKAVLEEANK